MSDDKAKATSMAFEKRFADDSGVEFGVSVRGSKLVFASDGEAEFEVSQMPWLISCLEQLRYEFLEDH